MGLFTSLGLAIVSSLNPVVGFFTSVAKWLTSDSRHSGGAFLIDLIGSFLPGGIVKDLGLGLLGEMMETDDTERIVAVTATEHDLALQCAICGDISSRYAMTGRGVTCAVCLREYLARGRPNTFFVLRKILSGSGPHVCAPGQPSISAEEREFLRALQAAHSYTQLHKLWEDTHSDWATMAFDRMVQIAAPEQLLGLWEYSVFPWDRKAFARALEVLAPPRLLDIYSSRPYPWNEEALIRYLAISSPQELDSTRHMVDPSHSHYIDEEQHRRRLRLPS